MNLGHCTVTNFGSYGSLSFTFNNIGLSLVSGATGSGKSTLFDIPCWILYGVTAKNGSVDEVRNWKAVQSPTAGTLEVFTKDGTIQVTRIRGKHSDNDLYWEENGVKIRGKDIKDTQIRLEARLGVTQYVYLTSSYLSEFSSISSFFVNPAKIRRQILDLISDTRLADDLACVIPEHKKIAKLAKDKTEKDLSLLVRDRDNLINRIEESSKDVSVWETRKQNNIQEYTERCVSFEQTKAQKIQSIKTTADIWEERQFKKIATVLEKLSILEKESEHTCPTCGKKNKTISSLKLYKQEKLYLEEEANPHLNELNREEKTVNIYETLIDKEKSLKNPFEISLVQSTSKLDLIEKQLNLLTTDFKDHTESVSLLEDLLSISTTLRGELTKRAIKQIEDQSNSYLEKYFDSEIRVSFTIPDSDSIEIDIKKNGYDCTYSQLSKGQRGLLKLCFSLAVMKSASNKAGEHFDVIFLDEALDGLDSELKVKAFNLLSQLSLEHRTVMIVDHSSEFKHCFPRQYKVELINDESIINEQ